MHARTMLFAVLSTFALAACDGKSPTSPATPGDPPKPRTTVVTFETVQFSVPDTIVADSATGRCDIPLTYTSSSAYNGQFDSSSVRVWETEMPLNAAKMLSFMGPIVAGLEHTGVLLDADLPAHVATAPYSGNFILYHYLNGVRQGGAHLIWHCVRYRTSRTPRSYYQ